MDELLSRLEHADPAEAPDVADEVADGLASSLEADQPASATPEPGGDR